MATGYFAGFNDNFILASLHLQCCAFMQGVLRARRRVAMRLSIKGRQIDDVLSK